MADFTTIPDFTFDETPQFLTLISEFENGTEQRRNKRANPVRKWHLVFRNRTKAEFETVRDFFISKKGSYSSFTWENPNNETEYTVRFGADSLTLSTPNPLIYNFEFDLIQDIQ